MYVFIYIHTHVCDRCMSMYTDKEQPELLKHSSAFSEGQSCWEYLLPWYKWIPLEVRYRRWRMVVSRLLMEGAGVQKWYGWYLMLLWGPVVWKLVALQVFVVVFYTKVVCKTVVLSGGNERCVWLGYHLRGWAVLDNCLIESLFEPHVV